MNVYIGVDPGAKGAIVAISDDHVFAVDLEGWDHPRYYKGALFEVQSFVSALCGYMPAVYMTIEKFQPIPKSASQAMYTMGYRWGLLFTQIVAWGVHYNFVMPRTWMCQTWGKEKNTDKQLSIKYAKQLVPDLKYETPRGRVLDGRCDAALIALYAKNLHKTIGESAWTK
jgi:hypothetical protein